MFENPEAFQAGMELAKYVGQKSTKSIFDRLRVSKETNSMEDQIKILDEIVSELLSEKSELVQIAQVYDEQLVAQKISEGDVEYIASNIIPLLEKFMDSSEEDDKEDNTKKDFEIVKPLLSKETFNMLQLLGFNYKRAIGEPLTELVNGFILMQKPISQEENIESDKLDKQYNIEQMKMINNEAAYERYKEYIKKE